MLLATSVDHDRAPVAGVRVNVLLSRYLIEPCGSGKSKLTYMCRIDLRYEFPPCPFVVVTFLVSFLQNVDGSTGFSLASSRYF